MGGGWGGLGAGGVWGPGSYRGMAPDDADSGAGVPVPTAVVVLVPVAPTPPPTAIERQTQWHDWRFRKRNDEAYRAHTSHLLDEYPAEDTEAPIGDERLPRSRRTATHPGQRRSVPASFIRGPSGDTWRNPREFAGVQTDPAVLVDLVPSWDGTMDNLSSCWEWVDQCYHAITKLFDSQVVPV